MELLLEKVKSKLSKLLGRHTAIPECIPVVPPSLNRSTPLSADELIKRTGRTVSKTDETLVHAYAKVLEMASGVAVDDSRLPAPKDDIKIAILVWLYAEQDPQTIELLRAVYLQLAMFQPGVEEAQLSINSVLQSRQLAVDDLLRLEQEDALELARTLLPTFKAMMRWGDIVRHEERQLMVELEYAGFGPS